MTENNKVTIDEILDDIDDGALLMDLVLESAYEILEDRILYGGDEHMDEALIRIKRGTMTTAEKISSMVATMEYFSKSGQSVADWGWRFTYRYDRGTCSS